MNKELGLRVLSEITSWPDERSREEFAWLLFMSRLKYDGYRDFQAGVRFIESLATWLQQFKADERETAYQFFRKVLVYLGPGEMQRLVELFYPRVVRERLFRNVAAKLGVPAYSVLANTKVKSEIKKLRRKTLFMALSEGARIETVRHTNAGLLNNEQMVAATQLDQDKWEELRKKLREDLKDPEARFALVYLVDDFMGTGTSFLRYDDKKRVWKGKLARFKESVEKATKTISDGGLFEDGWELCVHHYVASAAAAENITKREKQARQDLSQDSWAKDVHFSFGMVLPTDFPIDKGGSALEPFIQLTNKYYDPVIRTSHTDVGGTDHLGLGYGGCALPLILEHNTPNNSVALLWAETSGGKDEEGNEVPAMRPLFRRRQRHI
jgi:hypothetical protein